MPARFALLFYLSVEIVRTDREAGGAELKERVNAKLTSRFTRADGGYVLAQRMPAVQVTRNGKSVDDPLMEVVRRLPIDVELDAKGAFVRLTSGAAVAPTIASVFKRPEEAAFVVRMFKPEAIEEQSRREWDGKAARLFETPLVVGSAVRTSESLALGNGQEHPYTLVRTPRGYAQTQYGKAAVLSLACETPDGGTGSVSCEGQQVVAVERFLPVLWWMRLRAQTGDAGTVVTLEKTVRTTGLENASDP